MKSPKISVFTPLFIFSIVNFNLIAISSTHAEETNAAISAEYAEALFADDANSPLARRVAQRNQKIDSPELTAEQLAANQARTHNTASKDMIGTNVLQLEIDEIEREAKLEDFRKLKIAREEMNKLERAAREQKEAQALKDAKRTEIVARRSSNDIIDEPNLTAEEIVQRQARQEAQESYARINSVITNLNDVKMAETGDAFTQEFTQKIESKILKIAKSYYPSKILAREDKTCENFVDLLFKEQKLDSADMSVSNDRVHFSHELQNGFVIKGYLTNLDAARNENRWVVEVMRPAPTANNISYKAPYQTFHFNRIPGQTASDDVCALQKIELNVSADFENSNRGISKESNDSVNLVLNKADCDQAQVLRDEVISTVNQHRLIRSIPQFTARDRTPLRKDLYGLTACRPVYAQFFDHQSETKSAPKSGRPYVENFDEGSDFISAAESAK